MRAPSATSGSGRPAARASISVAPEIRLTRLTPVRSTSPVTREHAACRIAIDADTQVGAGKHGRDRRRRRSLRRPASEIDQPVVFGERERHGSRRLQWDAAGCCAARGACATQQNRSRRR